MEVGGRLVGVVVGINEGVLVRGGVTMVVGVMEEVPPDGDWQATRRKESSIVAACLLSMSAFPSLPSTAGMSARQGSGSGRGGC